MTRPNWAEISREYLLSNYRYLRGLAPETADLLAVVKANAYGHGLSHCAPLLATEGAPWLGVTSVEEGVQARQLCRDANADPRILIMSGVWHGEASALLEHQLTPVVWEKYHLDLIESAAQKLGLGPRSVGVHLELDTGMSRQGIRAPVTVTNSDSPSGSAGLAAMLRRFHGSSPLQLEGVATHFSAPEDADSTATADQLERLDAALDLILAHDLKPEWLHAGNSATLIDGRTLGQTRVRTDQTRGETKATAKLQKLAEKIDARLMLRPGLALYGYAPRFTPVTTEQQLAAEAICKPILSWKTSIISLRTLAAGETVGYNSAFRAARTSRIALLPIGYADGLNRLLSNRGQVLVRGARAPIAGRISMDQTVIDVTGIAGAEIGDEVVILGWQQGNGSQEGITAYDHADIIGTIPWEVLCDIGARVPRMLVD